MDFGGLLILKMLKWIHHQDALLFGRILFSDRVLDAAVVVLSRSRFLLRVCLLLATCPDGLFSWCLNFCVCASG
ncbi:hypothetical protein L6452_16499 [Arctium lappa]|uniref:Uncharacterized protein n=1 Tax=Arctium lappa TaxID=4217 RepID=A0ACB9C101_ARCLA|nr:hypothetical protein L6452_16499 [Arctium lappa]